MRLFGKLFGKPSPTVQDAAPKKVVQKIFNELATFDYSDFENLNANKAYDKFFAGNLKLPSGQVVCTDPMYRVYACPQSWTVAPGEYPVYLYIGLEGDFAGRIAYAELVFKNEIPAQWEYSLIEEILLEDDFDKKVNGLFPVENGLGCFSDHETWKLYEQEMEHFYAGNQDGNYYLEVLEKYFDANANVPASSRGKDWINYTPINAEANIMMFGSGRGDGLYPRYVGFDQHKQVVKMLVDFIQLIKT